MEYLILLLIISGTLFILLGNVGLFRLPDFFCRAHAVTKAITMGISLILLAAWLYLGTGKIGIKVLVALVFQYTTIPLSAHILGLVSFRKNIPRWKHRDVDQQQTSDTLVG